MPALPKILRNFNVLLGGTSFAGIATEVMLPKLTIQEEDHRGGGHDSPIPIDMGMEKMELSFTMAEHAAKVYSSFGLRDGQGVSCTFRGAKVDDKAVESYVVEVRGRIKEVDPGTATAGGKSDFKATLSLRYYKVSMGGGTLVEIDVDNMVRKIGGSDQLAAIRAAISA